MKKYWHKWVVIGRPRDDTNETYKKYKDCKKQYRQAVHTAEKSYERKWAQEVLNTGEVDQKTFWYLVNKRRKLETVKKLCVIRTETGMKCEPKELTDAWAEHFEGLSVSS